MICQPRTPAVHLCRVKHTCSLSCHVE
jgi:hypothetical protein